MEDEKYIVFKRNEFYEMMGALALPPYEGTGDDGRSVDCAPIAQRIIRTAEETALGDAVVIRRQDVFAPPALDAYANAITVALELTVHGVSNSERARRLKDIADYFHEQAKLAWTTNRKIPD